MKKVATDNYDEIEYGVKYPDGHIEWDYQPIAGVSTLPDEVAQAKVQEQYRHRLMGVGVTPAASNRLVFVARIRSVTFSDVEELS